MQFKFEKKPMPFLNQTWYHLVVDGKKVSQVIVEHLPQSPIHNIEFINTFPSHEGKGYMGKLLEHVRDDLLATIAL